MLWQDLLSLGFDSAILLLSAYANPVETIEHARQQGYQVTDFMVTPMPFGLYSSEPKVRPAQSCLGYICDLHVAAMELDMQPEYMHLDI